MTAIIINCCVIILLLVSYRKDVGKTKKSLTIALKKGLNLLPMMIIIMAIIGVTLAFIPPDSLQTLLGSNSGVLGVAIASLIGAVAMIPSIIALPMAGSLIDSGAGFMPVTSFITTLTMVGFVTIPLEIKELGKGVTFWRNFLSLCFAVLIGIIMGVLM